MGLLNFKSYEKLILESEEDDVSRLTSQIASSFLDVYGAALSVAPGYAKIMNDLDSLVEGDANSKLESMKKIVDSITGAIPTQYKRVSDLFKSSLEEVIKAYDILLAQESGNDGGLKSIANAISRSVIRFSTSLKEIKKEMNESSVNPGKYELLMETVLHKKQRNLITKNITTLKAGVDAKVADKSISTMHPFLSSIQREMDEMISKVNDEKYWESIKRRKDRIEELEKISTRLTKIGPEIDAKSMDLLRKLNADRDIVLSLTNSKKFLEDGLKEFEQIRSKEISDPKEDTIVGKTGKYDNIDPKDPQNMRKSGPNRERIEEYQRKTNEILSDSPGYQKISEDGLYGQNTIKALKMLQGVLNRLGAGLNEDGTLTTETQKVIDNFMKNKEALRGILKK